MKIRAADIRAVNQANRGWRVAKTLGWPSQHPGFRGATVDLMKPFAEFQRPRSSMWLVHHYQRQSAWAVHRRVQSTVKQLEQISKTP